MYIVDTHTHLYSKQFESDRYAMMQRAMEAGVKKFYLPAIDSKSTEKMLQMEVDYPGVCIAMMGLHPCSVDENYREELSKVDEWFARRKFAAVGEIGLDFYWDKTHTAQQYEAFQYQINIALAQGLPIVIHTRNAMPETIEVVKQYHDKNLRGIFHCFSGTEQQALEVIYAGFYLGIGGVLTYKNGGLAEWLGKIPLKHIVLETDAPYLAPVPFRGKRNETAYIRYIIEKLSSIYGLSPEAVATQTSNNAAEIFPY